MEFVLDPSVGHHFARDLAEAGKSVRNGDKAVLVELGLVAGHVPALPDHLARGFGLAQVADHDVTAVDHEHPGSPVREWFEGVRINDAGRDARQWLANRPGFVT